MTLSPAFRRLLIVSLICGAAPGRAQSPWTSLSWRMIGPHRGGRTKAGTGVPSQPNVFYIGVVNGGVWKIRRLRARPGRRSSTVSRRGSIGAIAVAPVESERRLRRSGEGLQRPDLSIGDGIYQIDRRRATWTHLGLRDGQQIPQIIVDPKNPDRLFVAVLGHPYGPNAERGVFRSTDGGKTFEKVLYKDENTGATDVAFDPSNPQTCLRRAVGGAAGSVGKRQLSADRTAACSSRPTAGPPGTAVDRGLPTGAQGLGRSGSASSAEPIRTGLYAVISAPDADRHLSIRRCAARPGRGSTSDSAIVRSRRRLRRSQGRPEECRTSSTSPTWSTWKIDRRRHDVHRVSRARRAATTISTSGSIPMIPTSSCSRQRSGRGRDRERRRDLELLVQPADGAVLSRQRRQRVSRIGSAAASRRAGRACIASRSDDGAITFRDWHPVGVEEYGYAAPIRCTRTSFTAEG